MVGILGISEGYSPEEVEWSLRAAEQHIVDIANYAADCAIKNAFRDNSTIDLGQFVVAMHGIELHSIADKGTAELADFYQSLGSLFGNENLRLPIMKNGSHLSVNNPDSDNKSIGFVYRDKDLESDQPLKYSVQRYGSTVVGKIGVARKSVSFLRWVQNGSYGDDYANIAEVRRSDSSLAIKVEKFPDVVMGWDNIYSTLLDGKGAPEEDIQMLDALAEIRKRENNSYKSMYPKLWTAS